MSWVKEVTTNIKSPDGSSRTHTLGKHTLLVGPNESGKSAIAEAVQLALTGSASGMLYRNKPIKSGTQLAVLRPEGCEAVFAQVQMDDGESAEWTLEEGKRPNRSGVEGFALPVDELRSVMSGSEQKVREFFYENILKKTPQDEIKAHLPESLWDSFDGYAREEEISLTGLITTLGKRKREAKAQGNAADMILKTLTVSRVSDSAISDFWLQLGEAQRLESLKEMYRTYREQGVESAVLGKIKASLAAIGPKEKIQSIPTPADARKHVEEAYVARGEYQAAFQMKTLSDQSAQKVETIARLEKALVEALAAILSEQKVWAEYRAKVNGFLPSKDKFDIMDNGSLKMGLARENGMHIALSGSTEARTLAAMAAALVSGDDAPALIVVDDRMWDPSTLAKTMKEMEKVDCQVIIMSTLKPRGKPRQAWTYVSLGGN